MADQMSVYNIYIYYFFGMILRGFHDTHTHMHGTKTKIIKQKQKEQKKTLYIYIYIYIYTYRCIDCCSYIVDVHIHVAYIYIYIYICNDSRLCRRPLGFQDHKLCSCVASMQLPPLTKHTSDFLKLLDFGTLLH
jgi:hypothetical protein